MKWLFGSLFVLLIAASLSLLAHQDPGYVIIARGYKTIEMSLTLLVLLILFGFIAFYFILRILIIGWNMPQAFARWRKKQKSLRAQRDTNKGLVELAQGNWASAERYLVRHVNDSEIPLLNYLSAARAAQKQSASERRDNYLGLAHQSMQGSGFAVQLTQAELQLVQGQLEQSLATLVQLHSSSPKHPHVLFLLARLYEMLKSWNDLKKILPDLRRYKIINEEQLNQLELVVNRELIGAATFSASIGELHKAWQQVPKALRRDAAMVQHYVRCLLSLNDHESAETIVRETLKKAWDVKLVYIYGLIKSKDSDRQLATAEQWLKNNENNPVLLLTAGRLCKRNQLWGKAQSYLDASVGIQPRSDTYNELGQLMEQLEENERAAEYFRKGLMLAQDEKLMELLVVAPSKRPLLPASV